MKKILVTGASGYIGGQTLLMLNDSDYDVIAIDRHPLPKHLQVIDQFDFRHQDFAAPAALEWIINEAPDVIIHCAGTSLVGPSITDPAEYFSNNTMKTLALINTVKEYLPNTRLIFSSSAAVYGEPVMVPVAETDPKDPISPYGMSKHMIENFITSYHRAYGIKFVIFRYFNACGADSHQRHGQMRGATHIIARVLETLRDNSDFILNGNDYDTPDGTCIRDYVHVEDIARAHILACDDSVPIGIYNLGSGKGVSNLDIIAKAQVITGRELSVHYNPSRVGDPAELVADSTMFDSLMPNWRKWSIDDMIRHAWCWYVR